VVRVRDEERRLTAIGGEGEDRYAVWFKDETNGSTTYGGYRVVRPKVVNDGDWTVAHQEWPGIYPASLYFAAPPDAAP
jgi:uncharacterized protein (DUF1684 family)